MTTYNNFDRHPLPKNYKIGNALRELREAKNLTQEQLAELLDVSTKTISRWETADKDIRCAKYWTVRTLVCILGVESEALLGSPEEGPFFVHGCPCYLLRYVL